MSKKKVAPIEPETRKGTALVVSPQQSDLSIEAVIQNAIASKTPVDVMERLLAMRTQLKKEHAKEAYDRSMAGFQAACPTIAKTKEVRANNGTIAYKYAPIESLVAQVKDLLEAEGFSYSFTMELREGGVKVVCKVTHSAGHSEESPMDVPFGTKTAVMSQSQVAAAATTFAKRYAFCNAFGIMTGDDDTDARAEESQKDRMTSYRVARVIPDESDEAGGYVSPRNDEPALAKEVISAHKDNYPEMNETNDGHGLDEVKAKPDAVTAMKMEIMFLLKKRWKFIAMGKPLNEIAAKVFDVTGCLLTEENFPEIINRLKHEE